MDQFGDALAAFGLTAVSELGDKSQLLLVALAARRSRLLVAVGGLLGITSVQLVSVLIGGWLASSGVTDAMPLVAGVLFVVFGAITLRSGGSDSPTDIGPGPGETRRSVLITSATLLFVAEMGDKTMFTSAALAAVRTPWAVFAGATLAFAVLTTVAVVVGSAFAERLPARTLRVLSGSVLLAVGAVILLVEVR